MTEVEQSTNFGLKLTGNMDELDADTLIDVLGGFSQTIQEINTEIQSNKTLKITIKHIQPGCFDVLLSIKETVLDLLKYASNISPNTAYHIIGTLVGLLTIRQFLRGEKPQKVEENVINKEGDKQITITAKDGNRINVDARTYQIFSQNQVANAGIARSFDALQNDDSVDGVKLYDENNKELCTIEKDRFSYIAESTPLFNREDEIIKTEEVELIIFKIVFEPGYKWVFYYRGNKISAKIKDDDFFEDINSGVSFSKGDRLYVKLEIKQVFDESLQSYINKEYSILKVKNHKPKQKQIELNNNKKL